MTRDIAAMAQQIEQLKANISELKAGQEQMAREMAKAADAKDSKAAPAAAGAGADATSYPKNKIKVCRCAVPLV